MAMALTRGLKRTDAMLPNAVKGPGKRCSAIRVTPTRSFTHSIGNRTCATSIGLRVSRTFFSSSLAASYAIEKRSRAHPAAEPAFRARLASQPVGMDQARHTFHARQPRRPDAIHAGPGLWALRNAA